jgi:hypothetical protein
LSVQSTPLHLFQSLSIVKLAEKKKSLPHHQHCFWVHSHDKHGKTEFESSAGALQFSCVLQGKSCTSKNPSEAKQCNQQEQACLEQNKIPSNA